MTTFTRAALISFALLAAPVAASATVLGGPSISPGSPAAAHPETTAQQATGLLQNVHHRGRGYKRRYYRPYVYAKPRRYYRPYYAKRRYYAPRPRVRVVVPYRPPVIVIRPFGY